MVAPGELIRDNQIPVTLVDVGCSRYTVEDSVEAIVRHERRGSDAPITGFFDGDGLRIAVCSLLPPDKKRAILVHECLHAILAACRLQVDGEEDFIGRFGDVLLDWMQRNPVLVDYLLRRV